MFHANGFVVDTQQTGPRGADKLFSVNWFLPMLTMPPEFFTRSITNPTLH